MTHLQTYADLPAPCFVRNTTSGKLFFCQDIQSLNFTTGQSNTILAFYGKGAVLSNWQRNLTAPCDYLEVVESPNDSIKEWVHEAWPHLKNVVI